MTGVEIYRTQSDAGTTPLAKDAITFTEAAARHVSSMLSGRPNARGLRLSVNKTGCSGYGYVVDFLDEIKPDDVTYPITDNPAWVVAVDPASFRLIKGTRIDYVRKGLNEVFVYQNPNQSGECGCGESFSVGADN